MQHLLERGVTATLDGRSILSKQTNIVNISIYKRQISLGNYTHKQIRKILDASAAFPSTRRGGHKNVSQTSRETQRKKKNPGNARLCGLAIFSVLM